MTDYNKITERATAAESRLTAVEASLAVYEISGGCFNKPLANQMMLGIVTTRPFSLPNGLAGSQAKATTGPSNSLSLTISKNGASVGSIDFATSATTGTFTFAQASGLTFAAGDTLTVQAPSSMDSSFANVVFTLVGTML